MNPLQGRPLLLLWGAALLQVGRSGSSSHSLHYFNMAIMERGWWRPQFSGVAYLDDHLIGRYETDTDRCAPQSSWIEEISRDDANFWARNAGGDFASGLVRDLLALRNLYNRSRGIHTLQVFSGCELSGDDRTRGFAEYGYNGRDFLSLDLATRTWTAMDAEATPIKKKWNAEQHRGELWGHFLTTCVDGLRTHLRYGKEVLQRIDPPTVHMTHKPGSGSLETLVCWARGFFPKEIVISWKRDGVDQTQDAIMGGVVPNSDGTYHTRLSIDVDPMDRRRFRCHVEHDGLLEPLDLAWEEPASVSNMTFVGVILGVILGVLATFFLVKLIFYLRKSQEGNYKGVQTGDQGSESSEIS